MDPEPHAGMVTGAALEAQLEAKKAAERSRFEQLEVQHSTQPLTTHCFQTSQPVGSHLTLECSLPAGNHRLPACGDCVQRQGDRAEDD